MPFSPTVLVGCGDLILLDEVIRHLEEIPHWQMLRSARTAEEVLGRCREADCVLIADALTGELVRHHLQDQLTSSVVVFGRQESAPVLRAALDLGARGFVRWPDEKERLRGLVERGVEPPAPMDDHAGALHAVWAPKGGAGATVIAAHLAGAVARLGNSTILVDMDLQHGDQTCVLGAEPDSKTVGDLLRVASELSASTVHSVLWSHPLGFRTVLSPGEAGEDGPAEPDVAKVLQVVRGMAERVAADVP